MRANAKCEMRMRKPEPEPVTVAVPVPEKTSPPEGIGAREQGLVARDQHPRLRFIGSGNGNGLGWVGLQPATCRR